MLTYKLLKETKDEYLYEYHPEYEDYSGIVSCSKNDEKMSVIRLAENDSTRTYANMMFSKLINFKEKGVFKSSGIIAWY